MRTQISYISKKLFNVGRRTAIRWVEDKGWIKRRGKRGKGKKPILLKDVLTFASTQKGKPYIGKKCTDVINAYERLKKQREI